MNDTNSSILAKFLKRRVNRWRLILVGVLGCSLLALLLWWQAPVANQVGQGPSADPSGNITLTRTALAATENFDTENAALAWDSLFQQSPGNESIALNRAINLVLAVDSLAEEVSNPAIDPETKKRIRSKLPLGISNTRSSINDFANVASDRVTPLWLRTRVDLHEASLLPGAMSKSLRREIADRLSKAINGSLGNESSSIVLGGLFLDVLQQMEDPVDGLPRDTMEMASVTIAKLSDLHPDNLLFALQAARSHIESHHRLASTYVLRARRLSQAIEPLLARETRAIGLTPTELVEKITTAIDIEAWSEADTWLTQWFNLLNGTELVKTDRRLSSPHPLDRLSFQSLRELSGKAIKESPISIGRGKVQFSADLIEDSESMRVLETVDFDLDLDLDLVTIDDNGLLRLWQNEGEGNWASAGDVSIDIQPNGLIVADLFLVDSSNPQRLRSGSDNSIRHDTFSNFVVYGEGGVRLVRVDGRSKRDLGSASRLELVLGDSGMEDVRGVTSAIAGDLESDGDLDLVLATEADGIRIFVNRGNRTFFELDGSKDRFLDDPVSSMAIADLDRDLDLDIVTTHARSGRVGIIENLLHLQFRARTLSEIPPIDDASSIAIEDVDGNVSWDLIVGGKDVAAIVFSQTADAGAWNAERTETSKTGFPVSAMVVADLDNDSWMEVITLGSDEISVSRIGPWGWAAWEGVDLAAIESNFSVKDLSNLVTGDFDGNGLIDLSVISNGQAVVLKNEMVGVGHYLNVRFKGIDDNASGRVNHYAIGSVLELRFGPHYRSRIVTSPSTHFGIDGIEEAVSIRAILPNGLTQTIRDPELDTLVEEQQTLKGSCPYLYAWDGEKYQFVTDCLWAAPLGLQVAEGVVAKDRPWEYLKVDGDNINPKDGRYEFAITEELWEVAYFDEVALTVVDHPDDVEIWTNEKVGPGDLATPTIFAFHNSQQIPLRQAVDTKANDVTDQLRKVDRDFVQGFDRRIRQGLCPPHWIDLSFEKIETGGSVYLVLTGWILPTDTSLNIQIDQNPALDSIEFPSVWVPDDQVEGGWQKAIPFMGFPGGKTKTIVVDVTDVIDLEDARLRVRTSAQIYWDHAELVSQSSPASFQEQPTSLVAASVGFHGFSNAIDQGPKQPDIYDYQDASAQPRWPPLRGKFSRQGDCLDLLSQWDDRMVVIGAGDEVRLAFSVPATPTPVGWKRDFILHNVGWDKDADLNTLAGQTVGPLPYRGMQQYPPAAQDSSRTRALEDLNRDHLLRTQSFRSFWFRNTNAMNIMETD